MLPRSQFLEEVAFKSSPRIADRKDTPCAFRHKKMCSRRLFMPTRRIIAIVACALFFAQILVIAFWTGTTNAAVASDSIQVALGFLACSHLSMHATVPQAHLPRTGGGSPHLF